jgi:lysophospholipase L1-like esterase
MKRFAEKLVGKQKDIFGKEPVTVAFLGDSVTQGCFELYHPSENAIETVFDYSEGYPYKFVQLLKEVCPAAQVNLINSGISGGWAENGLERLDRDIMKFSPDLLVVSFGLNDCMRGKEYLPQYAEALEGIFKRAAEKMPVIFMTPNMMCSRETYTTDGTYAGSYAACAQKQNDGTASAFMQTAIETAKKCGVYVCDCYKKWTALNEAGVDTTALLANHCNHPVRDMHWLFAWSLFETVFGL